MVNENVAAGAFPPEQLLTTCVHRTSPIFMSALPICGPKYLTCDILKLTVILDGQACHYYVNVTVVTVLFQYIQ